MTGTQSPMLQLGVRAASPLAVLVGVYLLFAGHNNPGGGFAAGLVFGAVIALRTVSGLQRPLYAAPLISAGLLVVAVVAVAPMLWGDPVLDQKVFSFELPLLGKMKTGSAFPFDIGVTAIVMGLVLAVLEGLGATDLASDTSRRAEHDHRADENQAEESDTQR